MTRKRSRERELALSALSVMRREKLSLTEAASKLDISRSVILRYVKEGLRRSRGDYYALPFDTIPRPPIRFLDDRQGLIWVKVKNSREATLISDYMTAVKNYMDTGKEAFLVPFRRKGIGSPRFLTDPKILDELMDAGELDFDKFYKFVVGARR